MQESLKPTGAIVGIDLGSSDDQRYDNPKRLARSQKRLARLQRQLSRKPKGSWNRDKARIKVARLHEKVANQRRDAIHKLTTQLIHDYDLICMETLVPKNMVCMAGTAGSCACGNRVRPAMATVDEAGIPRRQSWEVQLG